MKAKIWVRMSGYLVGDKDQIERLLANYDNCDVDFDANDIKGLSFVSENEGYIPQSVIEDYYEPIA